jgi:hypothetical protein
VLAYSRRLSVQHYSKFTRFEAKHFLLEAARFMDGTCPVCVIDNTSVMVADGTGADAVIAPRWSPLRARWAKARADVDSEAKVQA